jgi:hypothetical protein
MIFNQVQHYFQQHELAPQNLNVQGPLVGGPLMVHGVPVEDDVTELQLELQVVKSRLRSDAASIGGHVCESYEDTLRWVVAYCSPEYYQYVMAMLVIYSVVCPDGQGYRVLLEEESNSSKAGYASSTKACLVLSFKTKVPGIFGADKLAKTVIHLPLLMITSVKLLPLPQPPLRVRMDAQTNPSARRANQLRSVLARVYAVARQNQITTTVP